MCGDGREEEGGKLLAGKVPGLEGCTVAVVVSGGNVAGETASGILKPDPR